MRFVGNRFKKANSDQDLMLNMTIRVSNHDINKFKRFIKSDLDDITPGLIQDVTDGLKEMIVSIEDRSILAYNLLYHIENLNIFFGKHCSFESIMVCLSCCCY